LNGAAVKDIKALKDKHKDSRIHIVSTEIEGLTFSLNLGLHIAKGNLIARMDADDIAYPDRLLKQQQFFEKDQELSVCGTWVELIDDQNVATKVIRYPTSNEEIRKEIYYKNPLCHPAIMMKKNMVYKVGAYMGYPQAEDYDLWNRLVRNSSIKFANIPDLLLFLPYNEINSISFLQASSQLILSNNISTS
jgi:glycosyltransferase involved in cell wall biosynthesis